MIVDELKNIVDAILSLNTGGSLLKEYVFPIFIAFFSTLLGGFTAYFTIRYQESNRINEENTRAVNKLSLICDECFQNLIAIKNNYHRKLNNNPIHRIVPIPPILMESELISYDVSKLAFILQTKTDFSKTKWSQISLIKTLIMNYNQLMGIWAKRNELRLEMNNIVLHEKSNVAYRDIEVKEMMKILGAKNATQLIDLTELAVVLTDSLLIEFHDFISEFPKFVKRHVINGKRNKSKILTLSYKDNVEIQELIKESPQSEYKFITHLFGRTEDELHSRYHTFNRK